LIKKLFIGQENRGAVQLFRYIMAGGCTFLIDFSALFILTEFIGVYYLISAGLAFCLGLLASYIVSIFWIFSNRNMENRWHEFGLFLGISLIGLALNIGFMWFFTEKIAFHYLLSKVVAAALVFVWNFSAKKRILFR
jgi:putative flippase GtrA